MEKKQKQINKSNNKCLSPIPKVSFLDKIQEDTFIRNFPMTWLLVV